VGEEPPSPVETATAVVGFSGILYTDPFLLVTVAWEAPGLRSRADTPPALSPLERLQILSTSMAGKDRRIRLP